MLPAQKGTAVPLTERPSGCLVCQTPIATRSVLHLTDAGGIPGVLVDCPHCGRFAAPRWPDLEWLDEFDDVQRGALRGVLVSTAERNDGRLLTLTRETIPRLLRESSRPRNGDELITAFLARVARDAPAFGSRTAPVEPGVWAGRMSLHPTESLTKLARWIEQRAWIGVTGPMAASDERIAFELTLDGWRELHAREPRGRASTTVFVATWADPTVAGSPVDAICDAAAAAGLRPVVGCKLAGPNRVSEDIEAEIRRSRLVIADFTGGRAGVYWEAGFARGLGLPVIYTCHDSMVGRFVGDGEGEIVEETWRSRLHFDTTQFPHIFWSSPAELREKVLARIRANAWDEPHMSGSK